MILSFPIRAIPAEPNLIFSFESHQNKNALKNFWSTRVLSLRRDETILSLSRELRRKGFGCSPKRQKKPSIRLGQGR
jgi:hypothetical protein